MVCISCLGQCTDPIFQVKGGTRSRHVSLYQANLSNLHVLFIANEVLGLVPNVIRVSKKNSVDFFGNWLRGQFFREN